MSGSFFYPARPHDRALTAAGEVERLARAALRHLRTGRLGLAGVLHRRALAHSSAEAADAAGAMTSALAASSPTGPPVLYLPAVSWSYRFQRPQHLALALARAGHPVLYVDGFLRSRLLPARRVLHTQGGLHVLRMRVPGRPDPYREPLDRRHRGPDGRDHPRRPAPRAAADGAGAAPLLGRARPRAGAPPRRARWSTTASTSTSASPACRPASRRWRRG